MELYRIERIAFSDDLQHLTLTFETDGEPLLAGMNASALNDMMVFVRAALIEARKRSGPSKVVSADPVLSYLADATADRQAVILEITPTSGFAHRFAFDPQDATAFQVQIGEAVGKCEPA
jgi:hypothetical protein